MKVGNWANMKDLILNEEEFFHSSVRGYTDIKGDYVVVCKGAEVYRSKDGKPKKIKITKIEKKDVRYRPFIKLNEILQKIKESKKKWANGLIKTMIRAILLQNMYCK